MEAVHKKVIFLKTLAPRGLEATLFSEHTWNPAVLSLFPRPHPPLFPTSQSSEMTSNTSPFAVGNSQATTSNHKVVVDCHSQIAVRVSRLLLVSQH